MSLYLADTPALAGFYTGAADFPHRLRTLVEEETARIAVLATTLMEITELTRLGRLPPLTDVETPTLALMLERHGFELLAVDAAIAEQGATLPGPPGDLYDRLLIAAAQRTGRTVLTPDPGIAARGVPCAWALD